MNEIRRILIALPNDHLGGAEQYLKTIAAAYLSMGFAVDVFFLKRRETGAWEDFGSARPNLFYTDSRKEALGVFSLLTNIFKQRKIRYEYMFTSHVHLNSFVGLLRKFKIVEGKYHVGRESTSIFVRYTGTRLLFFKCIYAIGYSSLDLLICQSIFMKRQLSEALPKLAKTLRIEVIPNPVNLGAILEKSQDLTNLDFKDGYEFIVSAGRLIPEKGFDILIEAFISIREQNPNLKLIILGQGKERKNLEQQIENSKLKDDVIMPGFIENVYPYFKNARLCVVSSRIEGFPNVLLQMMSQNDKVVSTLCAGGIEELDGVFLAKPDSISDLTLAMKSALGAETQQNRVKFDKELQERSIESFINKIDAILLHKDLTLNFN